ncbi:response regulator transcription factor [Paraburkholderia sp. Ac-20340]|nr:response regulator transcription factor [Paraburkholderia sp. Ac-20340]
MHSDAGAHRQIMCIGLFEGNVPHGEFLRSVLTQAAYVCREIRTVEQLAATLQSGAVDLLIVIGLDHDGHGVQALNWVRGHYAPDVPVLIIGEPGGADAESMALNAGADDFILRTRSPEVLIARVASLLRWSHRPKPEKLERYGDYEFDTVRCVVTLRGDAVALTQREFHLAWLLFRHLDEPLSRAQIFESVWHQSFGVSSRTVDTHVCWLRSKLKLHPGNGFVVVSVHGYGYRLERVHIDQA